MLALYEEQGVYESYAEALQGSCLVPDPWDLVTGEQRFHNAPLVMTQALKDRVYEVAASIGKLFNKTLEMLWEEPELLEFFDLTPFQKLMWMSSEGDWHGFARMDLFICSTLSSPQARTSAPARSPWP